MPISPEVFLHNFADLKEKAESMLSFDNLFNLEYANDKEVLDWKSYQKDNWLTKCFDMDFSIKNPDNETKELSNKIKNNLSALRGAVTDLNGLSVDDPNKKDEINRKIKNIAQTFNGIDSLIDDVEQFNERSGLSETTNIKMNALRGFLRGISSFNTYMNDTQYKAEYNFLENDIESINKESEDLNKQIDDACEKASEKDISIKDVDNPDFVKQFTAVRDDKSIDEYFNGVEQELSDAKTNLAKSYDNLKNEKIRAHLFTELVYLKKRESSFEKDVSERFEAKLKNEEEKFNATEGIGRQYGSETQAKVQQILDKEKQLNMAQEKLVIHIIGNTNENKSVLPYVNGLERNFDPDIVITDLTKDEEAELKSDVIAHLKKADENKYGDISDDVSIGELYHSVLAEQQTCVDNIKELSKSSVKIAPKPVEAQVKAPAPEKKRGGFLSIITNMFNKPQAKPVPEKTEEKKAPEKIDNTDYWSALTGSMLAQTHRITDEAELNRASRNLEQFFEQNLGFYMDFIKKFGVEAEKLAELNKINDTLKSAKIDSFTEQTLMQSAKITENYINNIEKEALSDEKIVNQNKIVENLTDQLDLKKIRDGAIKTFFDNEKEFNEIKKNIQASFDRRNKDIDKFNTKIQILGNETSPNDRMKLKADKIEAKFGKCEPKAGENHTNTPLYLSMKDAFNKAKTEPSAENYNALTTAANKYLFERNKGLHLKTFAFSKRNERLNLAKDLINFASDGMKELETTALIDKNKASVKAAADTFSKVQRNLDNEFNRVQKSGNNAISANLNFVTKAFSERLQIQRNNLRELKYQKETLSQKLPEVQKDKKAIPEIPHINAPVNSMF